MVQTKVVQNLISYQKVIGHMSLSLPGVELRGTKDLPFLNNALEWESIGLNATKSTNRIEKFFK